MAFNHRYHQRYIEIRNAIQTVAIATPKNIFKYILKNTSINHKNTTESFMTSKRQFLLATESMEYLTQSKIKFGKNMPFELVSQDIRFFLNNIAEITGEISNNDLYDVLFSKFCIGK